MPRRTAESLRQSVVDDLKPRSQRYELKDRDVPGLCVVVHGSGVKSWVLRYGPKQERRIKFGDAGSSGMKLSEARKKAGALRVEIDNGGDPATDRRAERQAEKATRTRAAAIEAGDLVPGTVAELADRYLRSAKRRMKPRGFAEVARHIGYVVAAWRGREISEIRRRDVIALVEARRHEAAQSGRHEDEAQRGKVPAARLLAALSGLFGFAVGRDEMPANPARGISRADLGLKETPRRRVLSEAELRTLWPAFAAVSPLYGAVYRLILLTAMRPGEVLSLQWGDVQSDGHGKYVQLRAEATKEAEPRRVPLSSAACAELEAVRALGFDSEHVFASGGAAGHIGWLSAPTRKLVAGSGVAFRPHDLRRTARTLLGSIGVAHEVAERLLGHLVGTAISRVYDRHGYDAEQQGGAEALGAKVAAIVSAGAASPTTA